MATEISRRVPRISINKLGEYMTATPLRRRRIVQDQKRPKTFILSRYAEAQNAITRYLLTGKQDSGLLFSEIERLSLAPSATEWEEQRKHLAVAAIKRFLSVAGLIDLAGQSVSAPGNNQPRLVLGGLELSVRPEVLLRGRDRFGRPSAGAIKLCFSKSVPLGDEAGAYIATALEMLVDAHVGMGAADPDHCQVVDVFGGQVFTAPKARVRRKRDLLAACEEISRAWDAV